jgi:hypothetical protein
MPAAPPPPPGPKGRGLWRGKILFLGMSMTGAVTNVELRIKLGIPKNLNSHHVLHVKSCRGILCNIYANNIHNIPEHLQKQAGDTLRREDKIEKTCYVDLDNESLPDDFAAVMRNTFARDQDRRRDAFLRHTLPDPLTGAGVFFTLMKPLDDCGMPLRKERRSRSPIGPNLSVGPENEAAKQSTLSPQIVRNILANPPNFETYVHANTEYNMQLFLRATAEFKYFEETVPAVRQRLLETLDI